MQKLATLAAAAALAIAFGHAGTAKAQTELLTNGDAETGDLTGWVVTAEDPDVVTDLSSIALNPNGTYAFDMAPTGSIAVGPAGGTASLAQVDLDVSGCNVEEVGLLGQWSLDGLYVTELTNGDFGTVSVAFDPGPTFTTTDLISPNDTAFVQVTDSGDIPAGAATVDLEISGTLGNLEDSFANVGWDDVSLLIDCVVADARISGTMGVRPGRKDPIYAFGGAVGTLEGGDVVGAITIIYSELGPTRCTFTPTEIAYTDDTSVAIVADYSCEGGNKDGEEGTDATIDMTARDAHASCDVSDKNGRKNRGSIGVNSDGTELDISDNAGASREESCLATGNVIIAGPVE